MNIYLIGYRCTGKTSIGRVLADQLAWKFADMDDCLVAEAGQTITQMVAENGWPFFRTQEHDLLVRLTQEDNVVVGTGGGIVLDPGNVSLMCANGKIVWLRCRSQNIFRRMQADPATRQMRPALTDLDLLSEIESTLQERVPLYRAAAHIAIDTDDSDLQQIGAQIIEALSRQDAGFGRILPAAGTTGE